VTIEIKCNPTNSSAFFSGITMCFHGFYWQLRIGGNSDIDKHNDCLNPEKSVILTIVGNI